jgi:transcription-repair coupling factor (superfamily II helicase)
MDGIEREYLHLEYKQPDQLYVPSDQLDRVQKHLSPNDASPKIFRLTGTEWKKTVSKAREDAREFAKELIALYAQRKEISRPSFGPDSPWQAEMEATFPWIETRGQLEAINEVKEDMEREYPMDRLVCGDVGFGKTEVAIRAAFKAVQAGKQVAVLCPTTILSEQHGRSFAERLAGFPTKVGVLNRFIHAKARRQLLAELESGEVGIIIGTHALLSKDLKFKDLGLLVIDEEQKFGVKHKESLKQLRLSVDVLSMSATPIPRTLSMAMMNVRQMSVIGDPPPGRLPIRTFVKPHGDEVVAEAILREMARGGQVFYVTDKIQGINHLAEQLQKMIPSANIAIGHGQMSEAQLEPVMIGFIRGEIDILLSTTIVENGLDIPNANTLIVDNSDRFGLSQLYQLRGRVGRSDRQAYALFLYSDRKSLTENAEQRLRSLAEFSQLGAGYSLAVRDLQIRGAGDMIGKKQSGQMANVGYELYAQLIESEVQFLKAMADGTEGAVLRDPLEELEPLPMIDLPVNAFLPQDYIQEEGQRLYFYKKLMSCRDRAGLIEASSEMTDRYGIQPHEAAQAITMISLRLKAKDAGIREIEARHGNLAIKFPDDFDIPPLVAAIMHRAQRGMHLSNGEVIWPIGQSAIDSCEKCIEVFTEALQQVMDEREEIEKIY